MYGKLFVQMYHGTLATQGPWEALVTFQQLVILSDKHGVVDMTPQAIARLTTIPVEIIEKGIAALEQPDPHSRTPDEGGRRIVRLSDSRPWGWKLVNYLKYRTIRSQEERRAYMRQYQRERRQAEAVNKNVNKLTSRKQSKPIAVGISRMQKHMQTPNPSITKEHEAFIADMDGPTPYEEAAARRRVKIDGAS